MRRGQLGWILAILTGAVALASAVEYLLTGTFTPGWVLGVVVIYAAIIIATIILLALDSRAQDPPSVSAEALLQRREIIYATRAGEALRLTYALPDGKLETRHAASMRGEAVTLSEIETYADTLPTQPEPAELDRLVDTALVSKATRPPQDPSPRSGPAPRPVSREVKLDV